MNEEQGEFEEDLYEQLRIEVDPKQELTRIDVFLMSRIQNATRNRIQNGIKDELVKVNDKPTKANYKIRPGDIITTFLTEPPRNADIIPQDIPLDVVYEDDDLMIINKKPGMVVHPGYNNWDGTLVNALTFHFQNLPTSANGEARPGLVHRIDKNTSGLLVIAKSEVAMNGLAKQFFDHSLERKYQALVWGEPKEDTGTITANVGRSLKDRRMTTVFPDGDFGKHAVTHYKVIERFHYVTLIECQLETGRTHQIRAHMKYLGHPLFNDETYGGNRILKGEVFSKYKQFVQNTFNVLPRQALHAKTLGFVHPVTKKFMQFNSELPEDFTEAISRWRQYLEHRK